jgi:hypothetical protein
MSSVLTTFDGDACPWVLTRDDALLELASSAPEANAGHDGEVPPGCVDRPCDYAGKGTSIGPLVIATQRSPQSEMPDGVFLGFVAADGKLAFVDLWEDAGEDVSDAGTSLGPAHALAPFDCGGKLGLFAAPRTVAGKTVAPIPSLVAREGIYTGSDPSTFDRTTCKPLAWRLP